MLFLVQLDSPLSIYLNGAKVAGSVILKSTVDEAVETALPRENDRKSWRREKV